MMMRPGLLGFSHFHRSGVVLLLVVSLLQTVTTDISDVCMDCIVKAEHGTVGECIMDIGSLSCGLYQIKETYWNDCYCPGDSWKSCASDDDCARHCIRTYMRRYEHKCKEQLNKPYLSCEDYGRMHNGGGPKGCVYNRTLEVYVQKNMQKKCQVELQLDAEMVERNKTLEEKDKEEKDDDDDEDADSSAASTYTCRAIVSLVFCTLLITELK